VAYDKDSIQKAKEKGVFGDRFDPMSLAIPEEEKRRMAKGLTAAKGTLTENITAAERAAAAQAKQGGKKKKDELGIFAYFWRFLLMLFTGTRPSDYAKQSMVKDLRDSVKRIRPVVMSFSPDMITGELARQVHSLHQYLAPLHSLFDDTVDNKDPEGSFNFQLYYLMQTLPDLDREFENLFTEEGLQSYIAAVRDDMARSRVKEMVDSLIHSVGEEDRKLVNRFFGDVLNFYDLMRFNFYGFLRLFCLEYSVDSNNNTFNDIQTDGLVGELRNLESLILSVPLEQVRVANSIVGNYFQLRLREKMDEEHADRITEHLMRIGLNNYNGLGVALSKLVSGRQLTLIIRYIMRSREHEPRANNQSVNFFEAFLKNFNRVVGMRLERVLTRRRQEEIGSKMQELFTIVEPLKGYFYNDDTNSILIRMELSSFVYTMAFYNCMRFYTEKFPEHIKRTLNRLVVEGSYKDSLARHVLSEEFYRSEEFCSRLMDFSENVDMQKERGILLYGMIHKFKGNIAAKKALNARIANVNEALHPILIDIAESARNLQGVLVRLVDDIGVPGPKVSDNLSKIGAHNNARFLLELRKSAQEYVLFSSLIEETFRE